MLTESYCQRARLSCLAGGFITDGMAGEPVARRRYYTPFEVSEHNAPQDCWVSILGEVFDITPLVKVTTACPTTLTSTCLEVPGTSLTCAGSAGTCCCTSHSSCWNRHFTLVTPIITLMLLLCLLNVAEAPFLAGLMPRLAISSCLWTL